MLYLNFAAFSGDLEGYKERMDDYCNIQFISFLRSYGFDEKAEQELNQRNGAANQLAYLADACMKTGQPIYLFIDEYDHFTNAILSDAATERGYKAETHGTGAFRAFFDAIKTAATSSIKRLFVTGVSPVTMDDLTSGFNIGTNYTTQPEFNAMVGFSEQEVREMLDYYRQYYTFHHTTDELIEAMRPWYDNYCFSVKCLNEPSMFNSDMVLYFVDNYIRSKGSFPDKMLDSNIRTDYSRLQMLIRRSAPWGRLLPEGRKKDRSFEHDASIIQHIVETGGITAELKDSFPSEAITNPDNFVSLLYYFGMLTIVGRGVRGVKFRIPNQTVREQVYTYLTNTYRDNNLEIDDYRLGHLIADMAVDGTWRPVFEFIAEALRRFSSHRDKQKGEAYVHGFTLAQTCMSRLYLPVSELDAGPDGGYADIYLQPMLNIYPDIEHSYVLELKYLRSSATQADIDRARRNAETQLLRYADSEVVRRTHQPTPLHRLVLLWHGMELAVAEEI